MPRAPMACTCPSSCGVHRQPSPTSRASWSRPERRRRSDAVESWVRVNGWVCPGYGDRARHASHDLTAAHSVAVVKGGTHSVLTVLCRSCNGRQGTTES